MSQVFNTFLSVDKSLALETQIQMIGEGEQGLTELLCVGTALCLGRLLEGGNHSDRLAVIREHSALALGGGSRELGEASLGYPNANRSHGYLSIPDASVHEPTRPRGVTTFHHDRAAVQPLVTTSVETFAVADEGVTTS